ncbi:MAG: hypothetical protein EBS07_12250, partial [Sphingobacteriia bacterium]|nr:hypothetical protein [Sphingobacteriia bacterium]
MKKIFSFFALALLLWAHVARANNIQVANVALTGQDVSAGVNNANNFTFIEFDLSWQNSWRMPASSGLNNWDGAWVFVKFRKSVNGVFGPWEHARLSQSGHLTGSGTPAIINAELQNPFVAYNSTTNPVLGVFIYRSGIGSGSFTQNLLNLKWNYRNNNINDNDIVEVKVFAVEMVYIPGGPFDLGDGVVSNLSGQFSSSSSSIPFRVQSEDSLRLGGNTSGSLQNNNSSGMLTTDDFNSTTSQTLAATFPKGYQSFYMMKYEISQQQYVDFLNTLSRINQNLRTATDLSLNTTSVSNVFVMSGTSSVQNRNGIRCNSTINPTEAIEFYCDLNANGTGRDSVDGQWIACNFLNWADVATYLDWSGLRPMTELEYEKAARGYFFADTSQFAWGSKHAVSAAAINRGGQANEFVSTPLANAAYGSSLTGPLKVGAFSQNSFGRVSSGAGYFGAMELSGNISEICISIGNTGGRSYTGMHGDGMINTTFGIHNVVSWPGSNAVGVGRRGGNWQDVLNLLRISDRKQMNQNIDSRSSVSGGRGVRTVACQLPTTMPAIINGTDYVAAFSQINFQASGGVNYLWKLPNEIQLLTGQGSDSILAISPGSYAFSPRFSMLVSAVNGCGAGPERSRNINVGHFSNYDSAFIYNNYRIYVFQQVGTRNVTLFENMDSVRVVVVGGGGNGGGNRGGGGGSGHVRIRNDISLFSNRNLSVKVGNRLESSEFSNIVIAAQGTSGG